MILLLGGTSESAALATALAQAGQVVLVSTATDEPLDVGGHPSIHRRCGRLDEAAMTALIRESPICAIVDAGHPYATALHETAFRVARKLGLPYLAHMRPRSIGEAQEAVHFVPDHLEAARLAFSFGQPVLLTTGTNNLLPYAEESRRTGVALIVRVLPREESMRACRQAGIAQGNIIAAKGPFSFEQNLQHIRQYGIGTMVTKDSGEAGGVQAKLQAARQEHCQVVVIDRPILPGSQLFASPEDLLSQLRECLR